MATVATIHLWPVLDLVHRYQQMPFPISSLWHERRVLIFLESLETKGFHSKYPLLYLAFHGESCKICIGKNEEVTLQELAEILGKKCSGVVNYFGSYATFKVDRRQLQSFMERTETIAVLGYKQDVD